MKNKIKSVKLTKFFLNEGNVYYNQDEIKNGQVKLVEVGTLKKEFFNDFIEKALVDKKDIYIYSMDDEFVKCCAI